MAFIPGQQKTSQIEDFQYVENDIEALYQKYIVPIDQIRSQVGPGEGFDPKTNTTTSKIDAGFIYESRVNAFYRLIGFPAVAPDGSYYNTGYPIVSGVDQTSRFNTDDKILKDTDLKKSLNARQELFAFQNLFYSGQYEMPVVIRSIIMGRVPPKFNNLGDTEPLKFDEQKYNIDERANEFLKLKFQYDDLNKYFDSASEAVSSTIIGANFNSGKHLLKPFIVDPSISYVVSPEENSVALPFLKNRDYLVISSSPKKEVKRPVIESILRQRLTAVNSNVTFTNIASMLRIDLTQLDEKEFKLTKDTEYENVTDLIKTIMICVDKLISNIEILDKVSQNITWFPISPNLGPEKGDVGADVLKLGTKYASASEIKLNALNFKKILAQGILAIDEDLGDFAGPFAVKSTNDKVKDYDNEINALTENNKKWATIGFKALREIEIITGEVSGLGLIDILAIYTALWSIDIKTLMGFLDDPSYERLLKFNPSLEPSARLAYGKSILSSLQDFEKSVKLILTIVDKLIQNQILNPNQRNSINM